MAQFGRNGTLRVGVLGNTFPADAERSTVATGRDQRKTTRVLRDRESYRQPESMPGWQVWPRVSAGDLRDYCVYGCFDVDSSDVAVEGLVENFLESLRPSSTGLDGDCYAAAVLLGIFTLLGASLYTRARPLFDESKFPTRDFDVILYRLVVLPLAHDSRRVDHWLALRNWQLETVQPVRRRAV